MKMSRVLKLLKSFPKLFKQSNPSIGEAEERENGVQLPKIKVSKTKSQFTERFNRTTLHFPKLRSKTKSLKLDRMGSKSESNLSEVLNHNNNNFVNQKNLINSKGISKSNNSLQNRSNEFEDMNVRQVSRRKVPGHSSDVPRIVAGVIADATSNSQNMLSSVNKRPTQMERQMVRIINGCDPSCQSQILLNTRTSQPWEDLVRDLGKSVKLPTSKKAGNRLETLYGRKVKSYSQLRSELKVGNTTFYSFYESDDEEAASESVITAVPNLQKQRLSLISEHQEPPFKTSRHRVRRRSNSSLAAQKNALGKTLSTSSSELPYDNNFLRVPSGRRRSRRKSRTPSPNSQERRKSFDSRSPSGSVHGLEAQSTLSVHF